MAHTERCVEMARLGIVTNNLDTQVLEPGRELTPETRAMALEWLGNGNLTCDIPEECQDLS
ncbi:MAG: hypothetical protein ACRDRO_07860 [Pseudonocardiaceae bacterium]